MPKQKTRKELEAQLSNAWDEIKRRSEEFERIRQQIHTLQREREALVQNGVRLEQELIAERAEAQRMRGYIERVQEDDREDGQLLTVGEIDGEQQLVAKRKPTNFGQPSGYTDTCVSYGQPARRRVTY